MQRVTLLRTTSKTAVLLALPIILYTLPTDSIFNGESICLFKQLFETECWGCGITRAFFSVLHGHMRQAIDYNPLIAIVFPLLLWLWFNATIKSLRKTKEMWSKLKH